MIRQFKQFQMSRLRLAGGLDFAAVTSERTPNSRRGAVAAPVRTNEFPPRPDATVISEAIPLFYVSQNRSGFWLAREAEGRHGGLFVSKRSAVRFAQSRNRRLSCAIMILPAPIELDTPNQGSRTVACLAAIVAAADRYAAAARRFVSIAWMEWLWLVEKFSRLFASRRKRRAAVEAELLGDQMAG